MHKPTLQSEHSYLERDCFFCRLTVVLQTIHRRFPPLVSDGKWRAVSLSGLSVEGRPLLRSRWLPYLSKICRITCRRKSVNWRVTCFFSLYSMYAFNVDKVSYQIFCPKNDILQNIKISAFGLRNLFQVAWGKNCFSSSPEPFSRFSTESLNVLLVYLREELLKVSHDSRNLF